MTPPAQAFAIDQGTTVPEVLRGRTTPAESASVCDYEALRDAARSLLSGRDDDLASRRLVGAKLAGAQALLDEAATIPTDEVLNIAADQICNVAPSHTGSSWLAEQLHLQTSAIKRALAARVLGYRKLNDRTSIRALEKALKDPDADVRDAVVSAIGELATPAAIPALREALAREPKSYIREAIEEAIEELEG